MVLIFIAGLGSKHSPLRIVLFLLFCSLCSSFAGHTQGFFGLVELVREKAALAGACSSTGGLRFQFGLL
jgi:hypothetical protein